MISSLKGELRNISLSIEYRRYHILLDNFKMLKPIFQKDIQFFQEQNIYNNETYIKMNGIKITYMVNLNIKLFSNPNNIITDKSFFIDTIFNNVTFQLIDDYNIEFISCNISSIKIVQNNIISNLDYFNDFNDIFNEEGKNYLNNLKNIFTNSFSEKLIELEKNFNLLAYDMILIINNHTGNIIKDIAFIIDLRINKILTKNNFIKLNKKDNNIKISNLTIIGQLTLFFELDAIFNITCGDKNDHFIYERNKQNTNIELNLKDCKIEFDSDLYYTDIGNDFNISINKDYPNILMENADCYYKKIFEL
jgi:hypothetical protein